MLTALRALRHYKGRSFLTMLGIIIGISSIIAIMAIGQGAQERVQREILAGGDNYMFVHLGNWLAAEKGKKMRKKQAPFTQQDLDILKQHLPEIKNIAPITFNNEPITANGKSSTCHIKASMPNIFSIFARKIKLGSPFVPYHIQKRSQVVVIGSKIAEDLFPHQNPLGKTIQIGKVLFQVIGVVDDVPHTFGFDNPNQDIFIPLSTAQKLRIVPHAGPNKLFQFVLSTQSMKQMPSVVKGIKKILRARRRLQPNDPDDFMVLDQDSILKAAAKSSTILSIFLLIIACISLLVGGIGVMNIMLVSVKERTNEIGIRLALGARTKAILTQFLLEALILCCIGGFIGIMLGIGIPFIVSMFTGWNIVITPLSIIIATIAMCLVGIVFGYYPARKASQLDPVQALVEQ